MVCTRDCDVINYKYMNGYVGHGIGARIVVMSSIVRTRDRDAVSLLHVIAPVAMVTM